MADGGFIFNNIWANLQIQAEYKILVLSDINKIKVRLKFYILCGEAPVDFVWKNLLTAYLKNGII